MEDQDNTAPQKEAPKAKDNTAPQKEAQYEGDLAKYVENKENWPMLQRVAKEYGHSFIFDDKKIHANTLPTGQLRGLVTVAEAYRTGKIF